MTIKEALEIMCRRCVNNEVCMGTGCSPRNTIQELIDKYEKMIDEVVK